MLNFSVDAPAFFVRVSSMSMNSNPNSFADRRRLKRSLTLWRVVAVGLGVLSIAAIALMNKGASFGKDHLARVYISGMITENERQLEMLRKIRKSDSTKALILRINSTGGTTTGGEAIFNEIREIAKSKPVVAVFGTVAASAGYMIGAAADHIVARENTITGSIGVIVQWVEVTELLNKIGVNVNVQRSGKLKARPSPLEKTTPEGLQVTKQMVDESNEWFQALVKRRRKINPETIPGLTDGGIFSGRKALEYKLIDGIGGETAAISWLEEKRNIAKNLDVVEWKPNRSQSFSLLGRAAMWIGKQAGIDASQMAYLFSKDGNTGGTHLDGMVSVWHPVGRVSKH